MGNDLSKTTCAYAARRGSETRVAIRTTSVNATFRPMMVALVLSLILSGALLAGAPQEAWAGDRVTAGTTPHLILLSGDAEWDDDQATSGEPTNQTRSATRATPSFNTTDEALNYLRKQMASRNAVITFSMPASQPAITPEALFAECSDARFGDYLRVSIDTLSMSQNLSSTTRTYMFQLTYLTTTAQEQRFEQELSYLVQKLRLNEISGEAQKAYAIYNWICSNVAYASGTSDIHYTAYGALCGKQAVCQGYSALFYRLARAAGLSSRCVAGWTTQGTGSDPDHMWNIVKIGGVWYHLDSTWDGAISNNKYQWFLKTQSDFLKAIGQDRHKDISWSYNNCEPAASQKASSSFVRVGSKSATCTATGCRVHYLQGSSYYTETFASTSKSAITLAALGHTASAWRVYQAATTTRTGLERRVCTRCGAVLETKSIPVVKSKTTANTTTRPKATPTNTSGSKAPAAQIANGLTVKVKAKTFKVSSNKKKAVKLKPSKLFKITNAQGTVTFSKAAGSNAKITVSETGTVTIPKKMKRGKYQVVIVVTASGNATYARASKVATVKIQVK